MLFVYSSIFFRPLMFAYNFNSTKHHSKIFVGTPLQQWEPYGFTSQSVFIKNKLSFFIHCLFCGRNDNIVATMASEMHCITHYILCFFFPLVRNLSTSWSRMEVYGVIMLEILMAIRILSARDVYLVSLRFSVIWQADSWWGYHLKMCHSR